MLPFHHDELCYFDTGFYTEGKDEANSCAQNSNYKKNNKTNYILEIRIRCRC